MKKKQETFRNRVTVTVSVEMQFSLSSEGDERFDSLRELAESAAENWLKGALDRAQEEWARERREKRDGWPYPEMDRRPRARCTSIVGMWEEKDLEMVERAEDGDPWIAAEDGAMRCRTCRYPAPTHAPGCEDNKTKPCPVCADELEHP